MNITSVSLRRSGGEDGPADAIVEIEVDGHWIEVIREPLDANFSHCVNLDLLARVKQASAACFTTDPPFFCNPEHGEADHA